LKIKQAKRIILILLVLTLTVFCSIIILDFSKQLITKTNRDVYGSVNENSAVELSGEYKWQEVWDIIAANEIFHIMDEKALLSLAQGQISENNCYGKTFYLERSMYGFSSSEINGCILYNFAGTFDGQGYTIGNIEYASLVDDAFFCNKLLAGGTIRHVKFSNITRTINKNADSLSASPGGFIVHEVQNGASLTECIIEDITFENKDMYQSQKMVWTPTIGANGGGQYVQQLTWEYLPIAPLAYINNGTVSNCIVSGYFEYGTQDDAVLTLASACKVHPFVYVGNATNCLFSATVKDLNDGKGGDLVFDPATITNSNIDAICKNSQISQGGRCLNVVIPFEYDTAGYSILEHDSMPFYYAKDYNEGIPCLRAFMSSGWQKIEFKVAEDSESFGEVDPTYILIPKDIGNYQVYISDDSKTLKILDQEVVAKPKAGYEMAKDEKSEDKFAKNGWTKNSNTSYTANFRLETFTLTFGLPVNEDGDILTSGVIFYKNGGIQVTEPIVYENLPSGTEIHFQTEQKNGNTRDFVYSFTNSDGIFHRIRYRSTIYDINEDNNPGMLTEDTIIQPVFERKRFKLTLSNVDNSKLIDKDNIERTSDVNIEIYDGEKFTLNIVWPNDYLDFEDGASVIEIKTTSSAGYSLQYHYKPEESCYLESVKIQKGITEQTFDKDNPPIDAYYMNSNMKITPIYKKVYTVTFDNSVANTTFARGSVLDVDNQIKIKEGESIKAEYEGYQIGETSTLSFAYYDKDDNLISDNIATYEIARFYAIVKQEDIGEIIKVDNESDLTISPILTFYACRVTMGKIDSLNIATMKVENDTYGGKDGYFIVEYNTTVELTIDYVNNIYTYTFDSGDKITYTLANNKYAIQYEIDELTGEREVCCNGLSKALNETIYTFKEGETSKAISPTFGLKQYWGSLA